MKKMRVASLVCLLAFTLSASAVSVTFNQDDATRLDFTVLWGELPGPSSVETIGPGGSVILPIVDFFTFFSFSYSRWVPVSTFGFFVLDVLMGSGRDFPSIVLVASIGPLPDFVHPAEGTPYGARFIYGSDIPAPPTGVPDGGNTLILLAGALGTLGWLKRRGCQS